MRRRLRREGPLGVAGATLLSALLCALLGVMTSACAKKPAASDGGQTFTSGRKLLAALRAPEAAAARTAVVELELDARQLDPEGRVRRRRIDHFTLRFARPDRWWLARTTCDGESEEGVWVVAARGGDVRCWQLPAKGPERAETLQRALPDRESRLLQFCIEALAPGTIALEGEWWSERDPATEIAVRASVVLDAPLAEEAFAIVEPESKRPAWPGGMAFRLVLVVGAIVGSAWVAVRMAWSSRRLRVRRVRAFGWAVAGPLVMGLLGQLVRDASLILGGWISVANLDWISCCIGVVLYPTLWWLAVRIVRGIYLPGVEVLYVPRLKRDAGVELLDAELAARGLAVKREGDRIAVELRRGKPASEWRVEPKREWLTLRVPMEERRPATELLRALAATADARGLAAPLHRDLTPLYALLVALAITLAVFLWS